MAVPPPSADMPDSDAHVTLREYVEAIMDEQRRGLLVAEQEREKAAQALAQTLAAQIQAGDLALRDHIDQQIQQIRAALTAQQREQQIIHESSQRAIDKADELNKERWEGANAWRAQSADRERSMQDAMTAQSNQFLPREVGEAHFNDLRRTTEAHYTELRQSIANLAEKVSKIG